MEIVNELSVIVEFAQKAPSYGFEIVAISDSYPDAIIKKDGVEYRAEFEFKAKNFILHRHDPRQCDLIICWENNLGDTTIPILALSEEGWHSKEIVLPSDTSRELLYWKYRALTAEMRIRKLQAEALEEDGHSGSMVVCSGCGATFAKIQGLNAHSRFCSGVLVATPADIPATTGGHNGHGKVR